MNKILTVLVLIFLMSVSCKTKKNPLKGFQNCPVSEIIEGRNKMVTTALPTFGYITYDKNEKYTDVPAARKFIFFNDSVFACDFYCYDSIPRNIDPKRLRTITGQYKTLNDSVIEVVYKDGNKPLMIHVSHNDEKSDTMSVKIDGRDHNNPINMIARYIKWSWMYDNNIIMDEEWAFPHDPKSDVKWLVRIYNDATFSKQITGQHPDEISFIWEYTLFEPGPMIGGWIRTIAYNIRKGFNVNIRNLGHNYINISDERPTSMPDSKINQITLEYDSPRYRWYPDTLKFKKKADKLILLNHDGSESPLSLDILLQ